MNTNETIGMENANVVNYVDECASVGVGGEWLKLTPGTHKLILLQEVPKPHKRETTIKNETKTLEQSDILVEYNKKTFKWSITKGITKRSLWYQIMALGKNWKTLTGKPINVIVKSDGQQRDYTIIEALPFLDEPNTTK